MGERRIIDGAIYEKTPEGIVYVGPVPDAGSVDISRIVAPNPVRLAKEAQDRARQEARDNRADNRDERSITNDARREAREAQQTDTTRSNTRFTQGGSLRNSYEALPSYKSYLGALPGYAAGLQSGADPAGDLNLIAAYAKVLDPNSVVREGEAAQVAGADTWYSATVQRLKGQLDGSGKFTPEYRNRLREEMRTRMSSLNEALLSDRVRYKEIARRNGLAVEDIVGEHPGVRYQPIEERVFKREVPQLDYYAQRPPEQVDIISLDDGTNGPGPGIATGATRKEQVPEASALIDAGVRRGRSIEQVNAALEAMGLSPVDPRVYTSAQEYHRKHPGFKGSYGDATREVPTTAMNRLSASPLGTGLLATADAAMGGLSDELAAAVGGGDLATLNANKQATFAANPKSALTGQVAGGTAAMLGLGKIAAAFPRLGSTAPIVADVGFGAASGAGQANDNRTLGAVAGGAGAGAGTLLGQKVIAPAIGAAGRTDAGLAAVNAARNMLRRSPLANAPRLSAAQQSTADAISKVGVPRVHDTLQEADRLGMPFTLADVDPELRELAAAAVRRSPTAARTAESTLLPRARGQIDRFGAAVERDLGPVANVPELSDQMRQDARTAAAPLYDAAYAAPGASSVPLDDLINRPLSMRPGMARARSIAAEEGRDPNSLGFDFDAEGNTTLTSVPSFQTLDYVKRGLDDVLEPHRDPLSGRLRLNEATRAINATKNDLLGRVDAVNPDYAAARQAYAGPVSARDALARGQDAYSLAPDELSYQVARETPEHLEQMRLGYRSALMERANGVRDTQNPFETTLATPAAQQRLSTLYPDNPGVANLLQARELERTMAETSNSILGNSRTPQRQIADQAYANSSNVPLAIDVGTAMTGGVPLSTLASRLGGGAMQRRWDATLGARAVEKADEQAPMLLNPQGLSNMDLVQRLMDAAAARRALVDATTPSRSAGRLGSILGSQAAIGLAARP